MSGNRSVILGNVCLKIGSGATPRGGKEAYKGGSTSLIRSQNIYNDSFRRDGLAYIDDTQADELSNVEVQEDDVLLNITGDSVARCCQVAPDVLPARVNQHVAIIRPKAAELDARFLRYVLVSESMQHHLLALASAGATRNALTKTMIEGLEISAPPLAEQKRIAEVLGVLDEKIELNRRMNATLEATASALFQSWFVDFDPVRAKLDGRQPAGMDPATAALFPDSFEESPLGHIPKGWQVGSLGEVIDIYDSKRVPLSGREREQRKGSIPYHGAASVMDHVDDYLFDGIYMLLGEDGSVINDDGTPVIQYVWGKFWVNNHAHVLQGKNGICTEHLLLHLKQSNIAAFVTGAVQPKLNQGNMNRIPFILPSEGIGQAFAKSIEPLFAQIRANSDQSRTLATVRDTLLPKLLSGELSVREAERDVPDPVPST
jgi:type I restriction enzyme S subunit